VDPVDKKTISCFAFRMKTLFVAIGDKVFSFVAHKAHAKLESEYNIKSSLIEITCLQERYSESNKFTLLYIGLNNGTITIYNTRDKTVMSELSTG
jgi:uncharacterized pyridoxamine 5'-phosphate oxidase family protein